jgi:hypothetical protein
MSLSPATDRDVVAAFVPMHNRADVVGKTIELVRQRYVTVGDHSPDGGQAVHAKNGDFLAVAKLQWQLEAAKSRGAERRPFNTTSFDIMLAPVNGQLVHHSCLLRLHFRLPGTTHVESAIEWPKPHDAALSRAAK